MIIVLNWKYEMSGDETLDYIASVKFNDQKQIADDLNISMSGLKKRIKRLRDNGSLIVHRYAGNNFIYMVGNDAKMKWNKYDAYHIALHRREIDDDYKLFSNMSNVYLQRFKRSDTTDIIQPNKQLDKIVNKLVTNFNNELFKDI